MKKELITKFIEKYYLGGTIESVVWISKDKKLGTAFTSEDKTLVGNVRMDESEIEDSTFGIYTTSDLSKILSIMKPDINIKLQGINDKFNSIVLSDGTFNGKFILSDTEIIPKPAKLNKLPNFEMQIKIDKQFIDNFLGAKSAVDTDVFAIKSYDEKIELIMNYSTINSNNIIYNINGESTINFNPTAFSAEKVKNILVANKNCDSGMLKISSQGLSEYTFTEKNYQSTYYLIQLQLS